MQHLADTSADAIHAHLRGLFTDVRPNIDSMPYFVGRQAFSWASRQPEMIWVETEVCQLMPRTDTRQAVDRRVLITLLWDPTTQQGRLEPDLEPESLLTQLHVQLVDSRTLVDVPVLHELSAEDQSLLNRDWIEILGCLQTGADEMIEDQSEAGGDLVDVGFPERLQMTGAYTIHRIARLGDMEFLFKLGFQQQPWVSPAEPGDRDYVMQDVLLRGQEDRWSFELWTTSVP
ncbi:hypothetical protein GCM10010844_34780 [Deinococcus radiotolerans]|uniref:Uncharacterized protein n=1 Tax=Deinococcus radiotolerans TaxID=1309407 RepID=A0ABQ2FP41_9DEIO|nr:hypothetical protein GCM10010844_34780 [Deinococcus radiotolerans]